MSEHTMKKKFLLVGQVFHPGAVAVLTHGLRQGAPVTLVAEPENPYDALAVRVEVARSEVLTCDALEEALAGFGLTFRTLSDPFVLGHLGAGYGTKAAKRAGGEGNFALAREWHERKGESNTTTGFLLFDATGNVFINAGEE